MTATPVVHGDATVVAHLIAALVREAEAAHAQYPQYVGHWNGWTVVEITTRIRTKLGVAFEAGDLVLMSPQTRSDRVPPRTGTATYDRWPVQVFHTAYSRRNKIDTSVLPGQFREVTVTD